MAFPAGWDLVNITGTYVGRNGVPCVGTITLSSPQMVLRSGTIVPAADIVFTLDANGSFSGQIPATDDPNANPSGWVYTVTENVPGGRQGYLVSAPHTSPGIDLSTVIPIGMPMPPTFGFPYVTLAQLAAETAPTGASLIGFLQSGAGAAGQTIQNKLQLRVDATDFSGVDPTGATDSATGIQNAINHVQSLGGGVVYLPAGVYLIGSTLTITSNDTVLEGAGTTTPHDGGTGGAAATKLTWTGASSTVLDIRTPNSPTTSIQTGMGVRKLEIEGASLAATGLSVTSVRKGVFEDLHIQNCTVQQYYVSTYTRASMAEAPDTNLCRFARCSWRATDTAAVQNAHGFLLTSASPGSAGANTSFNIFEMCGGQVYNGTGWLLGDADNNTFIGCGTFIVNTGLGVVFAGSDDNYFWGYSCGGAGKIAVRGTASGYWQNPTSNVFVCADNSNGTQYPTLDANCTVQWHGSIYGHQQLRAIAGVFSGSSANVINDLLNVLGASSLLVHNGSSSHLLLYDGTNKWGINIDASTGDLRFNPVAGSGWVNVGNGTPVRLTGLVHSAGTAPPSGGTWSVGDLFVNTNPSVLGTAGSQYIVDHWRCVTAGSPGTWVACRTLTGT